MSDWWLLTLHEVLSQGDIVDTQPLVMPCWPATFLARGTKGSQRVWEVSDTPAPDKEDQQPRFLSRGRFGLCLVVSHDCELDKEKARGRVTIAPIQPIAHLDEKVRQKVMAQEHLAVMPLPGIPSLGDHCVDLRAVSTIDRRFVDGGDRKAGMTDSAKKLLRARLVTLLTRIVLE